MEEKINTTEIQLDKMKSKIEERNKQIRKLLEEQSNMDKRLKQLDARSKKHIIEREIFLNSTSWKITAPLRWISTSIKKFKRKIEHVRYVPSEQYRLIKSTIRDRGGAVERFN
ncbi:hypothetical protein ACFLZL_02020 [Thermodesulfobacteriota bacterium]